MTVQQKIKSVLEGMGETYLFEDWTTANYKLDQTNMPCVLNVLPASGHFHFGNSQLRDVPNCLLVFMDKADLDFNGEQNDIVVERCKRRAEQFIIEVNRSGLFEYIEGNVFYSVFYDKLDVNVTGITIELTLKETKGKVLCPTKSAKEIVYGSSKANH